MKYYTYDCVTGVLQETLRIPHTFPAAVFESLKDKFEDTTKVGYLYVCQSGQFCWSWYSDTLLGEELVNTCYQIVQVIHQHHEFDKIVEALKEKFKNMGFLIQSGVINKKV